MSDSVRTADVCVVGAGVSGLFAADNLRKAGLTVDVYEAQSHVGGRVKDTVCHEDVTVELGANWFSEQQPLIKAQIERFGIETKRTHNDGEHLIWWNDQRSAFKGILPSLGPIVNSDIIQGMARFERIMAKLQNQEPWDEQFVEYDHMSFGQWIDKTLFTTSGKQFFRMVSEMVFGVESHMVSFLYVLYYSNRSVSLSSLISVDKGHQELRFTHGPRQLCDHLAASIGAENILLNTPVRAIKVADGMVTVDAGHVSGRYRSVLCAMPPPAVKQVIFSPPRDTARERLLQALPMGRVIKVQAVYEKPYWLELGLSGQVMSNHYPLSYTIDNSPTDNQSGVLAAFVGTSHAKAFMAEGVDREKLVADAIDDMFGNKFPKPQKVLIEDWAQNEWIGGSYGAYFPPGVMSRMGHVLREHEPPIYWCGAEYAQTHPCQIEGALESGLRAAKQITEALLAWDRSVAQL
ncbi:flavin monoamine oxidase family protein [Pseudoalteromonas sp. T1lg23B]|uniref:flavin monoamine oxidase family protein n=1 Tax=Pseudoalteromonas sp. T1lg23B TaxID=2077097 RepID=UPI000CF5DDC6|nr:NAD(P)/FAD-dependent oxidoreductase [Pseudoalteromonas sp. T1lg23B]